MNRWLYFVLAVVFVIIGFVNIDVQFAFIPFIIAVFFFSVGIIAISECNTKPSILAYCVAFGIMFVISIVLAIVSIALAENFSFEEIAPIIICIGSACLMGKRFFNSIKVYKEFDDKPKGE